jgi:hypothetical protein
MQTYGSPFEGLRLTKRLAERNEKLCGGNSGKEKGQNIGMGFLTASAKVPKHWRAGVGFYPYIQRNQCIKCCLLRTRIPQLGQ